jgi:AhpD family alkylhydroperoxidase
MRIDYKRRPEVYRPMRALKEAEGVGTLEPALMELVRIRASQLNHCARCIEIHTKDARAMGEDDLRIDLVAAWQEAPCYTERERAALRWTEELTLLSERDVPDELYERTRAVFSEDELVQLTLCIVTINAWNRLSLAFRPPVGVHVARVPQPAAASSSADAEAQVPGTPAAVSG